MPTRRIEASSTKLGSDELVGDEVMPFVVGSSYDGGVDDVMLLLPQAERTTKAPEEPMPRAHEVEENEDEDNVPLA